MSSSGSRRSRRAQFDRAEENGKISISVAGSWCEYDVAFTWLDDMEALHVACAFDLKVQPRKRADVLNSCRWSMSSSWVGHFDLRAGEDVATSAMPCCWRAEPNPMAASAKCC
jgi:hypothetical protein